MFLVSYLLLPILGPQEDKSEEYQGWTHYSTDYRTPHSTIPLAISLYLPLKPNPQALNTNIPRLYAASSSPGPRWLAS
jgi:hypothetical protein